MTITQLVVVLRTAVESAIGQVWIKGEVTSFKAYGSGHWYFTLRDAESAIRCVMWKTYTAKVVAAPVDGTEVYALATPTVWQERGELRVGVQVMLPTSGIGLQQLARERVRAALEKDGLLDPARKRPLPPFPRAIALVTSADGAALRDIITVTRKRWPAVALYLFPAKVQGEEAPGSIATALGQVNRWEGIDLCIVGRG
ncbi:MAG: exodeoxyribonuclease VII large subunit, partial [Gemmatimonadales bacterium]|nr:exodeoxyribonuclease VII large subunit [Gemmatimonadales bacterium]